MERKKEMQVDRQYRHRTFLLSRRTNRFDRHVKREHARSVERINFPFSEGALASIWDTTERDETLRDKGSILERGSEDAVLVCEYHG